jgi:hypothetical protein
VNNWQPAPQPFQQAPFQQAPFQQAPFQQAPFPQQYQGGANEGDVLAKIEKLADLRARGILTDGEFATKKAELLSRL